MLRITSSRRLELAGQHVRGRQRRQGAIAVLSAILLVVMLGMVAFSVDIGIIALARTHLQRSVDAGALAGAGVLVDGVGEADIASDTTSYVREQLSLDRLHV
jgi:Flp pilus assembly protein TadG